MMKEVEEERGTRNERRHRSVRNGVTKEERNGMTKNSPQIFFRQTPSLLNRVDTILMRG
jgi:hypothetical protein